jgi:glycine cleavage system H protein
MSNIPDDLRYTDEHEWVKTEGDNAVIGITDHAQDQLGDVVFLELPEPGTNLSKGDAFGVVESVKAVSDLYAPIDGEVVEVNSDLVDAPEHVNADAYAAWLIKVKPADAGAVEALLDAAAYAELLEKEAK